MLKVPKEKLVIEEKEELLEKKVTRELQVLQEPKEKLVLLEREVMQVKEVVRE